MVKAFDFSLPGLETDKSDTECSDGDDGDDDDDDDDDNDENDTFKLNDNGEIKNDCLPKHARCYAHTLQLMVNDGLRECNSNLKGVIAKVSNVVGFVRKSVNASDILEGEKTFQKIN